MAARRSPAASRGEPVPEKTGVLHERTPAYVARKKARLLTKRREYHDRDYERWGSCWISNSAYWSLKEDEEARVVRQSRASVGG